MSQPASKIGLSAASLLGAWSTEDADSLPEWERSFILNAAGVALEAFPGLTESERKNPEQLDGAADAALRNLTSRMGVKELRVGSKRRRRFLTLRSVSKRVKTGLERLNSLVPYPRLTDRPTNLIAGWRALREEINRPVSRLAETVLSRVSTSTIRGE
jgi:hypothetical protein